MKKIELSLKNIKISNPFNGRKTINPNRDWVILIIIFIIMIIASLAYDALMYKDIVSGEMYVSVSRGDLSIETLKTNDLKKLVDNFTIKKQKLTSLKIENLVDPSL